jgi:hypothetical protein
MAQEIKHEQFEQNVDDFRLSAEQMVFMINIDAAAELADQSDDYEFFDNLTASDEWKQLFGEMSWDNAYDRYEIMIGYSS